MDFVTAVQDAYQRGPDEILTAAQTLYDTLIPENIPQVLTHLNSLLRSEYPPQSDIPIEKNFPIESNEQGGCHSNSQNGSKCQEMGESGERGSREGAREGAREGDARKTAVNLVILELNLYFTPKDCSQDIKALAFLSPASSNPFSVLLRIKYQDLLTDYQFLLAPHTKYLRLMDMVPKKINALFGVAGSNPVVDNIQLKILVYYLLGDSDFRDKSVLKYLMSEGVSVRYGNTPIVGFMEYKERLVPYDSFCALVQYVSHFYSFRRVFELFSVSLTENYLDSNLSKLPRYYTNVTLRRIHSLFIHDPSDVDVEAVVARMIINNKLPAGTHIDQIRGAVCFGQTENYDAFNTHVKSVCDIVESLTSIT